MSTSFSDLCLEACEAREAEDFKRMLKLLRKGLELNDEGCVFDLAYAYDVGLGLKPDKLEALRLYKRVFRKQSSQAGSAASNIAVLYREHGQHRLSRLWWERAATCDDGDAEVELARHFLEGRGVRRDLAAAKRHLKKALASSRITAGGRADAAALLRSL